ncbi:MAG: NADP-dependent malic enzyme, partial [Bacteroidetes bacterium]
TLEDAMFEADAFCGVSIRDILTQDMVKTMADNPIVFAMANPNPEITYPDAVEARPDVIMATGRSDYPNQVNNVLGFPYIFRGALDVQATDINEEMKMAAAQALAKLAKEDVPEDVKHAYGDRELVFGPEYIIPKPFDPRVLVWSASAVAEAAIKTGVARKPVDIAEYREELLKKIDWSRQVMRKIFLKAKKEPKRIVFPEGTNPKIMWAASEIVAEGIGKPILLAKDKQAVIDMMEENHHSVDGIEFVEPKNAPFRDDLIVSYYKLRQRKGITERQAYLDMKNYYHFGAMMVKEGYADGMVAGAEANFPDVLRPALQIIGRQKEGPLVAGMYMVQNGKEQYFFSDCAVNINPNAIDLAEITLMGAREMERLGIKPRPALLSFSNFGSVRVPETEKIVEAIRIVNEKRPDLEVDGPIQAGIALDPKMIQKHFPFSNIKQRPNLLIFPNLDAANISLFMLRKLGNVHSIGPILTGFSQPIHLVTRSTPVNNIINLAGIACVDAQKS